MSEEKANVSRLRIKDFQSRYYLYSLFGKMSAKELANHLVKEWVSYVDCRKKMCLV